MMSVATSPFSSIQRRASLRLAAHATATSDATVRRTKAASSAARRSFAIYRIFMQRGPSNGPNAYRFDTSTAADATLVQRPGLVVARGERAVLFEDHNHLVLNDLHDVSTHVAPARRRGDVRGYDRASRGRQTGRQHVPGRLPRPLRVADGRDVPESAFGRPQPSHRRNPAGSHWSLCDRTQAGGRGHGSRLRGAGRSSRAHDRREDVVRARQRRDRAATAVARGQSRGEREPSERLPDLRNRRGRRPAVHRDGAPGRRSAGRAAATGAVEPVGGGADRPGHAGCALRVARSRDRASRPEAVQRIPDRPRREAARLRPREAGAGRIAQHGHRADAHGDRGGHAAIHGARAGDRRSG